MPTRRAQPRTSRTGWQQLPPIRLVRAAAQALFLFPLIRIGYRVDVKGREHLRTVSEPCLLISNHNMHLDWSMLLRSFPQRVRARTAVAAAASDIFDTRRRAFTSKLLGNAYPFDREGSGVRESLEYTKSLLESGWNILIFPEGKMNKEGATGPFKSGVAWLASHSGRDVVPMRIEVLRPGIYEGARFPKRGRVRVNIGRPLRVAAGTPYAEATEILERAVREA